MNDRILFQSVTEFSDAKADKLQLIKGLLGAPIGGQTVEVPNRSGYVYVRLRDNQNEFISAYNSEVALVYDLPVLVARDEVNPNVYRVVGRDLAQYKDWGDSAYVPRHGNAHSFNLAGGGGGDIVWVYSDQIVPIEAIPSGSSGGPNVIIAEGVYWWNNEPVYAGNTGTLDILTAGNRPTGANGVRIVLVYLDGDTGLPGFISGDEEFDYTITGTMDLIPFLPDLPYGTVPITAVRIPTGTSSIVWENLYDMRNMYGNHFVEGDVVGGFTPGSVIFAGISGTLTEDNDEFYWDDVNKNLLLGNNVSPFSDDSTKLQLIGKTGRNPNFYMWGFSGTGTSVVPAFAGINFRGTQSNPTATLAGDILLRAFGAGHRGDALTGSRVRMTFLADGDWDGSSQGTYINFQVTHTGSATRRNVFDIHGDEVVFNPDMLNDLNFRMAGSVYPYMLYFKTINNRIGINNNDPSLEFQVSRPPGNVSAFSGVGKSALQYGVMVSYGGGPGETHGGQWRCYLPADYDSTIQYYQFEAREDDFYLAENGNIGNFSIFKYIFRDEVVWNEQARDINFRIAGVGAANAFFVQGSDGKIGFGTNTVPHGGVGYAKVAIEGAAGSANGPHTQWTVSTDDYPAIHFLPWSHDNICWMMDAYFDGAFRSSDPGSNFMIRKSSDQWRFQYAYGVAAGAAITWLSHMKFKSTEVVFNDDQRDINFRFESDDNANFLFGDAGTNRIGILTGAPSDTFEVNGYALFDQAHGELYTHEAGVSVDIIVANTWYQITGTTAGLSSGGNYVTLQATGGDITIGSMGAGTYRISFTISMEADKACALHGAIYLNGAKQNNISWRRDIANPNDIGSAAAVGLLALSASDVLDIRLTSDTANTDVDIDHMNVSINRIER